MRIGEHLHEGNESRPQSTHYHACKDDGQHFTAPADPGQQAHQDQRQNSAKRYQKDKGQAPNAHDDGESTAQRRALGNAQNLGGNERITKDRLKTGARHGKASTREDSKERARGTHEQDDPLVDLCVFGERLDEAAQDDLQRPPDRHFVPANTKRGKDACDQKHDAQRHRAFLEALARRIRRRGD